MTIQQPGPVSESAITGAVLFGRYAFPPNRLGYCGPDDHRSVFEYTVQQLTDEGFVELERRFDGAYPYLRLIALANRLPDPFDHRVVEAYWIGNEYLEHVSEASFFESLTTRFRGRMDNKTFSWLTATLEMGARPHHNFHVFDVYNKAGLTRDPGATITLDRMDHCRISWGRVVALDGAELVVERAPLVLRAGKAELGQPELARVTRQLDGRGFADNARIGDTVSIHWDWACERLSPSALARLQANTRRALAHANATM